MEMVNDYNGNFKPENYLGKSNKEVVVNESASVQLNQLYEKGDQIIARVKARPSQSPSLIDLADLVDVLAQTFPLLQQRWEELELRSVHIQEKLY
jgi:hypothetical protein